MVEVLKALGLFSVGIGVVIYFGKLVLNWILARDGDKFKSELQKYLAKFDIELQNTAAKHQIAFSSLHARRAEIIAELYAPHSSAFAMRMLRQGVCNARSNMGKIN